MAKTADDTNDSQFFITDVKPGSPVVGPRHLDFNHSVFGLLTSDDTVRQDISDVEVPNVPANHPDSGRPVTDVVMESVDIFVDNENAVLMLKAPQGASGETDITVTVTDDTGEQSQTTFHVTVQPDEFSLELDPVNNPGVLTEFNNSPPFLADIPTLRTLEGTPVTFKLTGIDVEGDPFTFDGNTVSNEDGQVHYTAALSPQGEVTVTPEPGFTGTVQIDVRVGAPGNTDVNLIDNQRVTIHVGPFVDLTAAISDKVKLPDATVSGDGTKLKLPIEIINLGNVKLPSGQKVLVTVHARPIGTTGSDDVLLQINKKDAQEVSVSSLKADGGVKKQTLSNILLPAGMDADQYQLVVTVDALDELGNDRVDETDEDNNEAVTPGEVEVARGFVDLTSHFSKNRLPGAAVSGERYKGSIRVGVTNEGTVRLPSGQKIDIQLVAINNADSSEILLGQKLGQSVSSLKSKATKSITVSVDVKTGIPTGNYTLEARVTPQGGLVEEHDNNNTAVLDELNQPVTLIASQAFVDLTVELGSNLNLPADQTVSGNGTNIKLPVKITNLGNVKLDSGQKILVTVHARPVGTNGSDDVLLQINKKDSQEISVSSLKNSGGVKKFTLSNVTLPADLLEDEYQLIVTVDSSNVVAESNEVNNQVPSDSVNITPIDFLIGTYDGMFAGDDFGTFTVKIDSKLKITGSGSSTLEGESFSIKGTASPAGDFQAVAGSTSGGANFSGTILQNGTGSGSWVNNFFGDIGTWTMTKL